MMVMERRNDPLGDENTTQQRGMCNGFGEDIFST
jgi:hypothetical protein